MAKAQKTNIRFRVDLIGSAPFPRLRKVRGIAQLMAGVYIRPQWSAPELSMRECSGFPESPNSIAQDTFLALASVLKNDVLTLSFSQKHIRIETRRSHEPTTAPKRGVTVLENIN
jgi:hypothetical protein